MPFQLPGFLGALTGNCGPSRCGGSAPSRGCGGAEAPMAWPAFPASDGAGPAIASDAGPAFMEGVPSAIGLPDDGGCPLQRRRCGGDRPGAVTLLPPAPSGGGATTWGAVAQPQGGGFLDGLLRGVGDLFRPAPQDAGLRQADAAVANVGRQGGQALDQVKGVLDQAITTGKGLLDRFVGFLRGVFGDVDRLIQGFRK